MKTRRICIGTVYRNAHLVVRGNLTSTKCLTMTWRGQSDWCQPDQFLDEKELFSIVKYRLLMAGIGLLEMGFYRDGSVTDLAGYNPVYCQVCRLKMPHSRAVRINRARQRIEVIAAENEQLAY